MNLAQLIKKTRESQEKSVLKLAMDSDLSNAYVSDIERGKKRPLKVSTLKKLAIGLGLPYKVVSEAVIESVREDLGE